MTQQACFASPSLRPVDQAEYVALALAFIAQIAPSLREDIRTALAVEVTEQLMGLRPRNGLGDLHTPILQLNRAWHWPELAEMFPFRLPFPGGFSRGQLWGGEHSTAFYEAQRLKQDLHDYDLNHWVWSQKMPTIREWRNRYLPSLPKRTSKYGTVFSLMANSDFGSEALKEYQQWRTSVAEEIARLLNYANQPPVPRHLEWLAWLVTHRLDAHHSYFNSTTGPQAFDARLTEIIARAGQAGLVKREAIATSPLAPYFTKILGSDTQAIAANVLEEFSDKLSNLLRAPSRLLKHFSVFRPNEFRPSYVCEECAQGGPHKPLPTLKPRLAPFHFLCRCRDFRWAVKSKHYDFPSGHDQLHAGTVQLWLAEALVGLSDREFPLVALYSYAQSCQLERVWQEKRQSSRG